ncbi:hypothetical protein KKB99_07990, partial [bacterium]|nr:hypothetical protein [bacterium]MBU1025931.1 hypothetical protein [bacterium]
LTFPGRIQSVLILEAINIGRRPVYFCNSPSMLFSDGRQMIINGESYVEGETGQLVEGKKYSQYISFENIRKAFKEENLGEPTAVRFIDEVGREYLCKFKKGEWQGYAKHIFANQ